MRPWILVVAVIALWISAPISDAVADQGLMQCSSNSYKYNYCGADTQGRVILLRELSTGNLCRQGRGWGFDNNGIWVDHGCRGEFSYGRDRDDRAGGGSWDRPGQLVCESIGYKYRYCNANTQNRVSLVRELSTGNLCSQGRNWGYDGGGIWVDRGCRGEFRFGQDNSHRNDAAIAAGILGAFAIGAAVGSAQNTAPPPPPPPPPPKPGVVPAWATGYFIGFDSEVDDNVILDVRKSGDVTLRHESGNVVNTGNLRDGMVYWRNGKRSWFAKEGPGVMIGDIDTGKHFYFRRSS